MTSDGGLLNDLLTLETNTIIKPEMTARTPFTLTTAILETVDRYQLHLVGAGVRVPGETPREGHLDALERSTLGEMATAAKTLILSPDAITLDVAGVRDSLDQELVLLNRIASNCTSLELMLARAKVTKLSEGTTLKLPPDDVARVRKIWDIGLERVVIQSVMQIDGDYVTRIPSNSFAKGNPALIELHGRMLGLSVDHYDSLIAAAAQLLRSLPNFFRR